MKNWAYAADSIVDTLYKCKPTDWATLAEKFPDFADLVTKTQGEMDRMNYFLGLNIADSPFNIIKSGLESGAILLVIGALLIPILSGLTQWFSVKLSTAATTPSNNSEGGTMGSFHEDDEQCYAADVRCILFHPAHRSWYLLGSQRRCAYDSADHRKQTDRQDRPG